jgi:hypothetical protein
MGELIHLRASAGGDRPRSASTESKGATILLFTGVRYQRHDQADQPEPSVGSNSPPTGGLDGGGKRKRRG